MSVSSQIWPNGHSSRESPTHGDERNDTQDGPPISFTRAPRRQLRLRRAAYFHETPSVQTRDTTDLSSRAWKTMQGGSLPGAQSARASGRYQTRESRDLAVCCTPSQRAAARAAARRQRLSAGAALAGVQKALKSACRSDHSASPLSPVFPAPSRPPTAFLCTERGAVDWSSCGGSSAWSLHSFFLTQHGLRPRKKERSTPLNAPLRARRDTMERDPLAAVADVVTMGPSNARPDGWLERPLLDHYCGPLVHWGPPDAEEKRLAAG